MQVVDIESLNFRAPEVAVFSVDQVPDSHAEWSEEVANLDLETIFGGVALGGLSLYSLANRAYPMIRSPQTGEERDWWAPDHTIHVDGTRWDIQPVFTAIGCKRVDEGAPPTEIFDSVKLLEISREENFWAQYGLSEEDLPHLSSTFLDTTYQREALPYLGSFMSAQELAALEKVHSADLLKWESKDLDELLGKMDDLYPPKQFDLVRTTPVSGIDSLFLDGGSRNSQLIDSRTGDDYTDALRGFRLRYLTGDQPQKLGVVAAIDWAPNKAVIFPQIGTFHRAAPGNEHNREINISFLAEAA